MRGPNGRVLYALAGLSRARLARVREIVARDPRLLSDDDRADLRRLARTGSVTRARAAYTALTKEEL